MRGREGDGRELRDAAFIEGAGDAAEGAYVTFAGFPPSELKGPGADYAARMSERLGHSPDAYAVYAYECVGVVVQAIDKVQEKDRTKICDAMLSTADFASLLGESPVVTATPMGACNGVYVSKIDKKGFTLTEQNNGHSTVEIAWIAVGDRVDANEAEIPAVLQSNDFDSNLKATMFNDGNKEGAGEGMYWDGSTIRFGAMPASTQAAPKAGGR